MKKKHSIVRLPSKTPSLFGYLHEIESFHYYKHLENSLADELAIPQHLYVLSDEEIKVGDWVYSVRGVVGRFGSFENSYENECRKIIATTDKLLIGPFLGFSTESGEDLSDYIPQLSQDFIKEYCKRGGVDEIDVEYFQHYQYLGSKNIGQRTRIGNYSQTPETWLRVSFIEEKLYTKEEVEVLCRKAYKAGHKECLAKWRHCEGIGEEVEDYDSYISHYISEVDAEVFRPKINDWIKQNL